MEEQTQPTVAGSIMDNLRFSPRSIKEMEDRAKKPVMQIVAETEMSNLALLVMRGLDTDENGAYQAIEVYLTENETNDTLTLQTHIIEKLTRQGFLPKKLNLADKVNEGIERASQMDMSSFEING